MGGTRFALALLLFTACGDDSGSGRSDANNGDGNGNGDGNMQLPCGFTETADATNMTRPGAEVSGLTTGSTAIVFCGTINTGHYDAPNEAVDGDFFDFNVAADGDYILHLTGGSGLSTPEQVLIQINKPTGFGFYGFGTVVGNHLTIATHLLAGEYLIGVGALNGADLGATIAYQVSVATDAPATRCPAKTGTATHAEGTDGGANDVVSFDGARTPNSELTAVTTDAPEASTITTAPATSYLITGGMETVAVPIDEYLDRDTYEFTTGAATNELSVRLNWPSTTSDLDFRVYPATTGDPLSIAGGIAASPSQGEFETFAVKPSTTYWLWVAASTGAANTNYSATICGETF